MGTVLPRLSLPAIGKGSLLFHFDDEMELREPSLPMSSAPGRKQNISHFSKVWPADHGLRLGNDSGNSSRAMASSPTPATSATVHPGPMAQTVTGSCAAAQPRATAATAGLQTERRSLTVTSAAPKDVVGAFDSPK
jgi:hypothetical protein